MATSVAMLLACTVSRNVTNLALPDESAAPISTNELNKYLEKYPGQDLIYIIRELSYDHSGVKENLGLASEWSLQCVIHYKYIILNPESEDITRFTIGFLPKDLYIVLKNPDGTVRRFGNNDLQKRKGSFDEDEYTLIFPAVVKGTTVELGYLFSVPGYLSIDVNNEFMLQFRAPCETLKFVYAFPDWWNIEFKSVGGDSLAPLYNLEFDPESHKQIIRYKGIDVPAFPDEPYSPYFREIGRYLSFRFTDIEMMGQKAKLPKNWDDIAENIRKTLLEKSDKYKKEITALVADLTKDAASETARLDTIVSYIQKNIRRGRSGAEGNYRKILADKMGNDWEIIGLTEKMLKVSGIAAEYVLIHTAEQGPFDSDYYSYDQFSIPAVYATADSLNYVICSNLDFLPHNVIPDYLQEQPALIISKESAQRIKNMPAGDPKQNLLVGETEIVLREDGTVSVTEKTSVSGYPAALIRMILLGLKGSDLRKTVSDYFIYSDGEVDIDTFNISNLEIIKEPLIVEAQYTIDNLIRIGDDEAIFQTSGLLSPLRGEVMRIRPELRVNPVKVPFSENYKQTITIKYPSGWTIASELNDISYANQFGEVSGHFLLAPGLISVNQSLTMNKVWEPREKITDLIDLTKRTSQLWIPTIVFLKD
jgi:hypothetical protein